MIFGMLVPLAADNGQTSQSKASQSVKKHIEVADEDEREKKNDEQTAKQSAEEHIDVADEDEREKKNTDQLG